MGAPSTSIRREPTRSRAASTAIGLALAGAICGGWLLLLGFGLFGMELAPQTLPVAIALSLILCWLFVGLFIVAHDAMHGSLAPGHPALNARIGALILMLYAGFSWTKLRSAHFEHHRHAGTPGDPDFAASHPRNPLRWYLVFLKRYFGWRSLAFVVALVWGLHLIADVPMANIVLFYGLPSIASSIQLFYFGTYRPHRHEGEDRPGFADRHNARSERFGPLASLASCYHFGYHLEHHRRPDIPWWGLPKARREGVGR